MYKVLALQISDHINIDSFMAVYNGSAELLSYNHSQLFYEVDTEVYVTIFNYGAVCFFNYNEERIDAFLKLISQHCVYFYDSELSKEFLIEPTTDELKFEFNKIKIIYYDIDSIKLIMLNIAQSVTLDYYLQYAKIQLGETNKQTKLLEKNGKLSLSDKELKKYIGKTHNLKNQIVENLYIFDTAPEIKQNEYLIKIDIGMKEALFMERRSNNIQNELEIIREHLDYFSNIMNHSASTKLEWIIIILLGIFVLNILIGVIFE